MKKNEFYLFYMCLFTFIFWLNVLFFQYNGNEALVYWRQSCRLCSGTDRCFFYVLSYPLFLYLGGTRLFQYFWGGSTPYQNGLFWPIGGVEERAKPFKPSWKAGAADEQEM